MIGCGLAKPPENATVMLNITLCLRGRRLRRDSKCMKLLGGKCIKTFAFEVFLALFSMKLKMRKPKLKLHFLSMNDTDCTDIKAKLWQERERNETKGMKSTKIMMHFEQSVLFADKSRTAHSQNGRLRSAICLHFHFNETSFVVLANGIITLHAVVCQRCWL